ncbi:cyclic pyranopterin monophosphate synthase MoaC [Aestuariibacter halophilus]|uniref:Cyclic pyranopterin monophosphate synthase n=1 Tax=Fluctibacter halophilus TaxID=226011 RepID=A0ABS8G3A2_9ALTE|nr:cyclic pyranopterin monophosphate synthase MoaC [Aestuariibacter halophilus]MCC2615059.1 cyclic pyranopterin monophosphate synthase MoaC [Aestuariibacter halophilus]
MSCSLTHVDAKGQANMVDVTKKKPSHRMAVATCFVQMQPQTLALIDANQLAKGDVFAVARIAGIQAAKRCADLIPLCHPLMLSHIDIAFKADHQTSRVYITARCQLTGATGVEMEALTAASIAAVTLFDMCKAVDPGMQIEGLMVVEKQGGKSGDWQHRSHT